MKNLFAHSSRIPLPLEMKHLVAVPPPLLMFECRFRLWVKVLSSVGPRQFTDRFHHGCSLKGFTLKIHSTDYSYHAGEKFRNTRFDLYLNMEIVVEENRRRVLVRGAYFLIRTCRERDGSRSVVRLITRIRTGGGVRWATAKVPVSVDID